MTRQINLYEAKTHLSRLVEEAATGDIIVIAKDGKPMAQLGPVTTGEKRPRQLGQLVGHAEGIDWVQWWHDWKSADKDIEADFEEAVSQPLSATRQKRRHKPKR